MENTVDLEKTVTKLDTEPTEAHVQNKHEHVFTDGGAKAWLTVFGGFCALFSTFGWSNAIGVFQDYYETHQLAHLSSSTIGWIASLQLFILFFCGIIVGRLFDALGPHLLLPVGAVLEVLGLMMTSICHTYGQILVCQGLIAPIGASLVFYTAVASIPTHFHKKRGLAMGIASSGSSLGGTIFPIMVLRLTQQTSFGWTMRACAFLILGLLTISCLTITSNAKHSGFNMIRPSDLVRHFGDIHFSILAAGFTFTFWGLFIPFDFITSSARHFNIDTDMATYLVSILNGVSIVSRISMGFVADKLGRYNVNTAGITLAGIVVFVLWMPSTGLAPYIVFAVFYGFSSGTFISLGPACCAQISEVKDIGTRVGLMFAVGSIGSLTGIPICGAIIGDGTSRQRWLGTMAFAGAMILIGSFFTGLGRVKKVGFDPRKIF
ncbi:major facilitator superfamily domain-containing protein [Lipomyces arxii]|uniref:major facilitator superfamily domain-containing protein n=1 Tax=Lipomyces arxii TaxID=56418 RepID=UPI0034CE4F78